MIEVELLDNATTPDPIRSLYLAYRVAYSALTPSQLARRIESARITHEQMLAFIELRLATGHASPLQQVVFEFGISGVSRAFSHQFVRHHVGIDIEQQSQRYVEFKDGKFPYTVPPSIARNDLLAEGYHLAMGIVAAYYDTAIAAGIPAEDARFVLPNATNTNLKVTVNFLELQHMADLRLCTRAQWEIRKVMAMMRACIMRRYPVLAKHLQPKCGEHRLGYCDESYEAWQACPIGRVRPHKSAILSLGTTIPAEDLDF